MTTTVLIACDVSSTDYSVPLGLEIWLDGEQIQDINPVDRLEHIEFTVKDADGEHELSFKLKNKLPEHTKINDDREIIRDATIKIDNVEFDDIPLGQVLTRLAEYQHDHNGTGPMSTNKFYGEIGCNGQVTLKFSTPIYLWMLDHM